MTGIEVLRSAIGDVNSLHLTGIQDWHRAIQAIKKMEAVIEGMKMEQEAKQKANDAALEEAKQNRKKQLEEAAKNGEEILGGETIRINADGTQEVIVP